MRFDDGKTEALNLRVSPAFKAALKTLAEAENRSMVNMLEVLVMDRLGKVEKSDTKSILPAHGLKRAKGKA